MPEQSITESLSGHSASCAPPDMNVEQYKKYIYASPIIQYNKWRIL